MKLHFGQTEQLNVKFQSHSQAMTVGFQPLCLVVVTSAPPVAKLAKFLSFCRLQVVMRRAQDAVSAIDFGNAVTWVRTCCVML